MLSPENQGSIDFSKIGQKFNNFIDRHIIIHTPEITKSLPPSEQAQIEAIDKFLSKMTTTIGLGAATSVGGYFLLKAVGIIN